MTAERVKNTDAINSQASRAVTIRRDLPVSSFAVTSNSTRNFPVT